MGYVGWAVQNYYTQNMLDQPNCSILNLLQESTLVMPVNIPICRNVFQSLDRDLKLLLTYKFRKLFGFHAHSEMRDICDAAQHAAESEITMQMLESDSKLRNYANNEHLAWFNCSNY